MDTIAATSIIINRIIGANTIPTLNGTSIDRSTVYPKKYAHGFVVLCFVVVMQSFIMNSHEVFIHIHQGCFAGTGAIVRLPQCQWSKPDGYGKISQCITTTKHSKAKTVCIFLGIYCTTLYIVRSELSALSLSPSSSSSISKPLSTCIVWINVLMLIKASSTGINKCVPLTHWGRMTHICVSEIGHRCFR